MNTRVCKQFESTRMLDALGELDRRAEDHSAWVAHLDACPACRAEVNGIRKLAEAVRDTRSEPAPTEAETRTLAGRLTRTLRTERPYDAPAPHGRPQLGTRKGRPYDAAAIRARLPRLIPALAAAGLLIALGWIGLTAYGPDPNPPFYNTAVGPDDRMILRDYEVIRNLDLLREMETVRKLVQHVDHAGTDPRSSGADETIGRGDIGHEWWV